MIEATKRLNTFLKVSDVVVKVNLHFSFVITIIRHLIQKIYRLFNCNEDFDELIADE